MSRGTRIALLAAAALVVAVSGTVFATRQPEVREQPAQAPSSHDVEPQGDEADGEGLARAADRLGVSEQELTDLSTIHGFGGAVRLIAWSQQLGVQVGDIEALRAGDGTEEGRIGWGQLAKQLSEEHGQVVRPGIGSIMGNGGGHGRDNAPGQHDRGEDDASGG